jgi:hypothetical protein
MVKRFIRAGQRAPELGGHATTHLVTDEAVEEAGRVAIAMASASGS